ncbi:uncharacterized protein EKO05_0002600 [Ascochyta rabiei]|uniref:Uncharacterized protein n=1 Tax=Didymella rabiei TaxID=5454 RepID=A0A163IML8_DIDRA|nr:uncharacterized protein EKO05_0002600 [Ascochyta rabiei]KZM25819.1 hypothetical protein ST47_g3040 [Ascochyta rabiei]UPX12023.1 hypothetical protein EKO05_0002600 [Ascochyta rabiei]
MASSTRAPMPSYPGTILPIHDHPAWKHLSGTTMETTTTKAPPAQVKETTVADKRPIVAAEEPTTATKVPTAATKEPKIYVPTGNKTLNRFSDITTSTRRSSYASTTKSQLRQSNQKLFEMLQNVQTELATHRAIMHDLQTRLSFIEQDAPTMVEDCAPEILSPADDLKPPQRPPPPPPPRRTSSLIPPGRESQSWWQACQNFAENCETPFDAQEFLKTSARFEDFDFHFGGLSTGGESHPPSPIEIIVTPALSPKSKRQPSENDGPRLPIILSERAPRTSSLTVEDEEERDSIIEQIVEFRRPAVLRPLLLHPPPSGRTASFLSVEEITALPDLPPVIEIANDSQRHRKGIRSISSKWASLKGRSADSGDYRKGFFSMR